uniref:glucose-1-phosphate adenylyltransferase n=1 Tax=Zea mays TaxID=4577 RepID=A0A804NPV2_MAIZE
MDMALASKASPPPWNATAAEQPIPKRDKAAANDSTYLNPQAHDSVLGIILGGGAGTRLYPLTKKRAKPAVPLAYGSNIGGYKNEGFVEVLAAQQSPDNPNWFQGTADAVRQYLWLFEEHNVMEFLILAGDHLYRMDYEKFIQAHRETNADITVAALPMDEKRATAFGLMKIDEEGRIIEFAEKPKGEQLKAMMVDTTILGLDDVRAKEMPYIASMGIYVFSKDVMLQLLREQFPEANDFGSEVIPGATSIGKRVQAYLYDGYWEDIGTIAAFYNANLGITKKPIPDFSFYDRFAPIYTQPRHLPPSKVLDADVTDSVIGEGCVIKNCKINHSVVGLRSCISEGAIIEDSLLMGADYYEKLIKNSLPKKVAFLLVLGKIHASGEQSLTRMLELETMLRYSMLTMFKKLQWRQTGTSSKVELSQ